MQPKSVTQTGVGVSDWQMLNWHAQQFQLGIGCQITGAATYTVEYTYDDLTVGNTINGGTGGPSVFQLSGMTDKTANADTSITWPVTFVRLKVTAGAGSVRMVYLQSGLIS